MTSRAARACRAMGVIVLVLCLLAGASLTRQATATSDGDASPPVRAAESIRLTRSTFGTRPAEVVVGPVTRHYVLGGAPAVAGGGKPLLLLFHGLDQSTPGFLRDVNILASAARAGVVVAAPISPIDAWNDGRFGPTGPHDDAFAMAIIGQLAATGTIDPTRVTVAGFSNGAGMAIELAARHPGAVAALVSVDGELLSGPDATLPRGPVPAYFIHGTNDPVQPIGGRPWVSERKPGYVSERTTIGDFLRVDGESSATPTRTTAPRHRGARVGPVTITRWAGAGLAPVTFASVAGMGHRWPALACGGLAPGGQPAKAKKTPLPPPRCDTGGGPDTRASDISADGLIVGVAASTPRRDV